MTSARDQPLQRRWSAFQAAMIYTVAVALVLLVIVWALKERHDRELDAAQGRVLAQAELMAEWASGTFNSTDNTLSGLANLFALSIDGDIDQRFARAFESLVSQRQQSLPFLDALGIISHTGETLYTMGNPGFPGHDMEERAFIRRFLQDHEQSHSDSYWNPESGDHRMLYLRRMYDADGFFLGVAAARLDLFFFTHALQRLTLDPGESIAVIDDNLRLIARRPDLENLPMTQALGMQVDAPAVAELIAGERSGAITLRSPLAGDSRIFGIGRVEGMPIVVVVGYSVRSVLASWYQQVVILTLGWLLTAALGLLILLHYLRLSRTEAELQCSEQALREINHSLQAELRIAAMAFETHLGMFITDARGSFARSMSPSSTSPATAPRRCWARIPACSIPAVTMPISIVRCGAASMRRVAGRARSGTGARTAIPIPSGSPSVRSRMHRGRSPTTWRRSAT
ncbi:hypothetical protein Q427_29995 [Halomonas sp. BC04]|nr:hypothetical protein [Halomonas sp. BC04]EWG98545.1 hypothetical protein Q427_29995 [Halomonas sp. BC04]